ncbi:MAG TPA: ATPase domain-containing protein [Ktedonobacterales bacterium]|nr:ATPase domain-containing protein [Ktedonobacterales bacterium]HEX5570380.1 ATPase domain-containing protein [Ktedonobacterales bacterium]
MSERNEASKRRAGAQDDPQPDAGDQRENGIRFDATGVPNLDETLGGGIVSGSLALIVGPPGSGKTTLANQLAFAAARAGRRAVVVTAMSEPTSKLIAHLRTFDFYDDALVGGNIQFLSLEQYLSAGLQAAGEALIEIARKAQANLVVLDGFRGVRGADIDLQATRKFLYDVGTTLSVFGMTTIITSEADPRDPVFFPESTIADIIIGLHYGLQGVRHRRALEIIKMRGAQPLSGLHSIHLSAQGLAIYPRLASRMATVAGAAALDAGQLDSAPAGSGDAPGRASVGVAALDALLGGGLTEGSTTLVVGSLGTGKTLLALHFVAAGLSAGEPTVFLGFRESQARLRMKADAFDLGKTISAGLRPDGLMTLQTWAPIELNPDMVSDRLVTTLDRVGARRLVIDSVIELESAIRQSGDPNRAETYLASLVEALRLRNVTALFIREHDTTIDTRMRFTPGPLAVLAENVLLLQQIEEGSALHRALSVVKMRYSAHDVQIHEFEIRAPDGIHLLDTLHTPTHTP